MGFGQRFAKGATAGASGASSALVQWLMMQREKEQTDEDRRAKMPLWMAQAKYYDRGNQPEPEKIDTGKWKLDNKLGILVNDVTGKTKRATDETGNPIEIPETDTKGTQTERLFDRFLDLGNQPSTVPTSGAGVQDLQRGQDEYTGIEKLLGFTPKPEAEEEYDPKQKEVIDLFSSLYPKVGMNTVQGGIEQRGRGVTGTMDVIDSLLAGIDQNAGAAPPQQVQVGQADLNADESAILTAIQNSDQEVDWAMVEKLYPSVDINKLKAMLGE